MRTACSLAESLSSFICLGLFCDAFVQCQIILLSLMSMHLWRIVLIVVIILDEGNKFLSSYVHKDINSHRQPRYSKKKRGG